MATLTYPARRPRSLEADALLACAALATIPPAPRDCEAWDRLLTLAARILAGHY